MVKYQYNPEALKREIEIDLIEMELDKELGINYNNESEKVYLQHTSNVLPEKVHKRKVAGVISWLGNKYGWSKDTVMWVRVGTVVGTLLGVGYPLIVYLVLMFFAND